MLPLQSAHDQALAAGLTWFPLLFEWIVGKFTPYWQIPATYALWFITLITLLPLYFWILKLLSNILDVLALLLAQPLGGFLCNSGASAMPIDSTFR
jgi:hypothetical protein